MPKTPTVAGIVVAYNGGEALLECIESLIAQTIEDLEVIVVDNASTDGSIESVEDRFGDSIRVFRREANGGYAAGANTGWRSTAAEHIAILNQDLVLAADCLEQMQRALLAWPREALVTPKLVLKSDPTRVNAIGNNVHLSGVAWCHGLGTPSDAWHGTIEVVAISGALFMATRSLIDRLGGLEEAYFMYMEDVDLSLRARLTGATCLAACDAVAAHDWWFALSPGKFGLIERNRHAFQQRLWGGHALMLPFRIQAELMGWAYAVSRGYPYIAAKVRATSRPLRLRQWSKMDSDSLVPVLATAHPYHLVLHGHRRLARLGIVMDAITVAASEWIGRRTPQERAGLDAQHAKPGQ